MKKFFALLLALVMSLSLVACGGGDDATTDDTTDDATNEETGGETTNDYKISVVLKTLSSEYWGYVKAGCDAAAAELGVEVSVVGPGAESEIEGQVAQIEQRRRLRRHHLRPQRCRRCRQRAAGRSGSGHPRSERRHRRGDRGPDHLRGHLQRGRCL